MSALRLLLLALFVSACSAVTAPPPKPEPTAICADVCARGVELGCAFALPTDGGSSCVEVCDNVQSSGIIEWDLACRASASSCEAIDLCEAP